MALCQRGASNTMTPLTTIWRDPAAGLFLRVFLLLNAILLPLVMIGIANNTATRILLLSSPGLAAIVVVLTGRSSWTRLGLQKLPILSILMGCMVTFICGLVMIRTGLFTGQIFYAPEWDWSRVFTWGLTHMVVLQSLCWSFGEELGWRGFLSTRITAITDERTALCFVWLLWLAWHIPAFWLMVQPEGAPAIQLLSFAATLLALTVVMNTFRWATGSVWPAVFIHTGHNQLFLELPSRSLTETGGLPWSSEMGWGTAICWAVMAFVVFRFFKRTTAMPIAEEQET